MSDARVVNLVLALMMELRYAGECSISDDYERGYRHCEDDIKRKLIAILAHADSLPQ
jgi:hypothetical protein